MREPDLAAVGPVQHSGCQCPRLRHKCQRPNQSVTGRKAGIQANTWNQRANAVGPQDAQQKRSCGIQHGLLQGLPVLGVKLLQTGCDHDGGARAFAPQRGNQTRHGVGWRTNHGERGCMRQ